MGLKIYPKETFKISRAMRGFNQAELARRAGITKFYMNQIENGKQTPSPHVAAKICEALGVEFTEVFTFGQGE